MTGPQPFSSPGWTEADAQRFVAEEREHTIKRQQMKKALRSVMTPLFRRHGFTGTSPFFRRLQPERYDLFMFDFCRGHDGYTIQVGQCAPDDIGYIPRQELAAFFALRPLNRLDPESLRLEQRARVQPRPGVQPGDSFEYGAAQTPEDYKAIALATVPFVEKTIAGFEDFANFSKIERLDKR